MGARKILGELFEGLSIVGPDGGIALIDVEAVMLPAEKFVGLTGRDPLEFQQSVDDCVAEVLWSC